nr:hypothetical protein HmN_000897200 [Hymenolepis microstoma]
MLSGGTTSFQAFSQPEVAFPSSIFARARPKVQHPAQLQTSPPSYPNLLPRGLLPKGGHGLLLGGILRARALTVTSPSATAPRHLHGDYGKEHMCPSSSQKSPLSRTTLGTSWPRQTDQQLLSHAHTLRCSHLLNALAD